MAVNEPPIDGASPEDVRIGALYRNASVEEPPPHLDALIHDAALRETRGAVSPRAPRWWEAWRLPFAFAALAVLSVSVVMLSREERGDPLTLSPEASAPAASEKPRQSAAPDVPPIPPAADEVPPRSARESQRRAESATARQTQRPEPQREAARLSAPEPSPQAPAMHAPQASGQVEAEAITREPRAFNAETPTARDTPATSGMRGTDAARSGQPLLRAEPRPAPARAPQSAPPSQTVPPPSPPGTTAPAEQAPVETLDAGASTRARRMDRSESTTGARSALALLVTELDGLPPSRWLERITALRREGRREDAAALLAELKRRYPEEPLPPALQ